MMQTLSLNGQWLLTNNDESSPPIPARVPGCVHLDLLAAHQLDDPYYRDNEARQFWVGETDWLYTRHFDAPAEFLAHERVLLRCHGLDTIATIQINGQQVGQTDNMYRLWEFDAKPYLQPGANTLEVCFESPMKFARRMDAEKGPMAGWVEPMRVNSGAWIRKEPCNFGWDWGPKLMTSGIWRDIELIGFDTARLSDVRTLQDHSRADQVRLTVAGAVEQVSAAPLTAQIEVALDGQQVAAAVVTVTDGTFTSDLVIEQPQLWWVNGLGAQPLYTVTVRLSSDQTELDRWERRIGLRVLKLERHRDAAGESFGFSINGRPFFAKGADWIPADTFAARVTRAHLEKNLRAATDVHMNMLRVWGGGIYEEDMFYDLCDELGIAIWQDFMFACGTYPSFDDQFMSNVTAEARDTVRRIRHHPCLALWCGNNEIEQGMPSADWQASLSWADYGKLFDDHLARLVAELDPQRDYWPGSPHKPLGERHDWMNSGSGDSHLWAVWHGKQPFEWYRTRADRFISEFGFQSFPQPSVIREFTLPEDRNITSYVMEYHQRSAIGNSTIIHYMLDWFRLPTSFGGVIMLSQILQGLAMQYGVEHWRRNMPVTMGTLYWQLNDCWPAPSWASLDYHGNWKALHYLARRFYAPLLISGVEDADAGTVAIHVTSDRTQPIAATLRWTLTTLDGQTLATNQKPVTVPPNTSARIDTVSFADALAHSGARNLLIWLALEVNGALVSDNLVLFARPKHLALPDPQIGVEIAAQGDQRFEITLTAEQPALFVWVEADGVFVSDNFFHLPPHQLRRVTITTPAPISADDLRAALKVRSLVDTYR